MVSVRDKDGGAKALKARLKKGIPSGRVGVYGDLAAQKHKDSDGATVGEIAAAHEFVIGPRMWLRGTMQERKAQIERALVVIGSTAIRETTEAATGLMKQLTLAAAGWCQERIAQGIPPALDPAYLKRKLKKYPGATTPLIASGQFRQSIAGEVER